MAEIAVLVKTREREEALYNCLCSVRDRLGEQGLAHRIYLADDGPVSEAKRAAYGRLRDEGHVVRLFDEPVGVSRARNVLADQLADEPWVLKMDDDFQLTGESDVAAMRRILREVPELGLVSDLERQVGDGHGVFSGQISDGQGWLERRGSTLVKRLAAPGAFTWERVGPYRFARCDYTRNLQLLRRELLEDVRWDDRLVFAGEHADFLLQVQASPWEAAFTPDSVHLHREDLGGSLGGSLPAGLRVGRRETGEGAAAAVLREKWGVERMKVRRPWLGTLRAALVKGKEIVSALVERGP